MQSFVRFLFQSHTTTQKDLKLYPLFLKDIKRVTDNVLKVEEQYVPFLAIIVIFRYARENTMVYREKVPDHREFDIPEGVTIMTPLPYTPAPPAEAGFVAFFAQ